MSQSSRQDLIQTMSQKTDEELYEILQGHPEEYSTTALEAANEEFRKRNIDESVLHEFSAATERMHFQESQPLSPKLKMIAFVFSTALFGIPVLVAWSRFSQRGERRKAHDWARWASYGFIFYVVLGVLSLALGIIGVLLGIGILSLWLAKFPPH